MPVFFDNSLQKLFFAIFTHPQNSFSFETTCVLQHKKVYREECDRGWDFHWSAASYGRTS